MAIPSLFNGAPALADITRIRVKVCGITRQEDAAFAISQGADALGFVFYPKSPRCVTVAQASTIVRAIPAFVSSVGLFVDQSAADVERVLDSVPLSLLQFHGNETAEFCRSFNRPYIKALRMAAGQVMMAPELSNTEMAVDQPMQAYAVDEVLAQYPDAAGFLFDTYKAGVPGGTGDKFDWASLPAGLNRPVILAGGLHPENVAKAVSAVSPFAVDVSSGLEIEPGVKSNDKVRAFFLAMS